jgi:cytochrome b561
MTMLKYRLSARLYHWISAVIVLGMLPVGEYLGHFNPPDGPMTDRLYMLHESFGVALWVVVLARLVSRQIHGTPPMPDHAGFVVDIASKLNHLAMYVILLVQPVTGFLANSAGGYGVTWFNVVALPSLIGKDQALSDQLTALHKLGGLALIVLVCIHLLGAIYHGYIRRDGVVSRMV